MLPAQGVEDAAFPHDEGTRLTASLIRMRMGDMGNLDIMTRLLARPHTATVVLELFEGLAQSCDEMMAQGVVPGSEREVLLNRRRNLYASSVGVDPFERDAFRKRIESALGAT